MQVDILPVLQDNYTYVLRFGVEAAVIDPGDSDVVIEHLEANGLRLVLVALTHHHADHVGGAQALRRAYGCRVVGPDDARLSGLDARVGEGDRIPMPGGSFLKVLSTPGHTATHVTYFSDDPPCAWTGDTLFGGGCGRLLEGTAEQLWSSLLRLMQLPHASRIYCGHEYTLDNLEFALALSPGNPDLRNRIEAVSKAVREGRPTVPSLLSDELHTNPFLRADDAEIRRSLGLPPEATPLQVFTELRLRKDRW